MKILSTIALIATSMLLSGCGGSSTPSYEVIDKLTLINGSSMVEVLIASYSRSTPESERAATLLAIAEKENANEVYLYNSREAQKAQYSESFMSTNPDKYRMGYLGKIKNGNFTPPTE